MHRIVTPEGSFVQSKWLRFTRAFAYACFVSAGGTMLLNPNPPHLIAQPDGVIATAFLFVGSMLSLLGVLTDRWIGEYVGLPLLGTAMPVLGLLVAKTAFNAFPYGSVSILLMFLGFGWLFSSRWRSIVAIKVMAHHVADQKALKNDG